MGYGVLSGTMPAERPRRAPTGPRWTRRTQPIYDAWGLLAAVGRLGGKPFDFVHHMFAERHGRGEGR